MSTWKAVYKGKVLKYVTAKTETEADQLVSDYLLDNLPPFGMESDRILYGYELIKLKE